MYTNNKHLTMNTTAQARENYAFKKMRERLIAQPTRASMSPVQFMTCLCLASMTIFFLVMSLPA